MAAAGHGGRRGGGCGGGCGGGRGGGRGGREMWWEVLTCCPKPSRRELLLFCAPSLSRVAAVRSFSWWSSEVLLSYHDTTSHVAHLPDSWSTLPFAFSTCPCFLRMKYK